MTFLVFKFVFVTFFVKLFLSQLLLYLIQKCFHVAGRGGGGGGGRGRGGGRGGRGGGGDYQHLPFFIFTCL